MATATIERLEDRPLRYRVKKHPVLVYGVFYPWVAILFLDNQILSWRPFRTWEEALEWAVN